MPAPSPAPYLRLRFERQRRNWTQATLGQLAGRSGLRRALTQNEVSAIELGRLNPRPDELAALARALGVSVPSTLLHPVEDVERTGDAIASAPHIQRCEVKP